MPETGAGRGAAEAVSQLQLQVKHTEVLQLLVHPTGLSTAKPPA